METCWLRNSCIVYERKTKDCAQSWTFQPKSWHLCLPSSKTHSPLLTMVWENRGRGLIEPVKNCPPLTPGCETGVNQSKTVPSIKWKNNILRNLGINHKKVQNTNNAVPITFILTQLC